MALVYKPGKKGVRTIGPVIVGLWRRRWYERAFSVAAKANPDLSWSAFCREAMDAHAERVTGCTPEEAKVLEGFG